MFGRLTNLSAGDECQRYLEYLQRTLVREGSEEFLQGQKQWFEKNREAIAQEYSTKLKGSGLATSVMTYSAQGEYDDFFSRQIFEPLLAKVLAIASNMGVSPERPVRFANSPDVAPSAAALPSTSEHVLFAGLGTSAFCNYWAKVFSAAIAEVSTLSKKKRQSTPELIKKLRAGPVIMDAARLAGRYALSESLVGYGKLEQRTELLPVRVLLLNAMEVFVVAHEVAHFVAHEEFADTAGIRPGSTSKQHEMECDAFALAVCTEYGVREKNAFAFQLIGPLLFFYALRMSERAITVLSGKDRSPSESHPTNEERFRFALDFLKSAGASAHILKSVTFALDLAMIIGSHVHLIMEEIKSRDKDEPVPANDGEREA
ncbi:hypothetical protein GCM10027046_16840 [Uliginosibacterium flavum]